MKHATLSPHFEPIPRYEVIGADGQRFGPFQSEARAAFFATVRWPEQTRDPGHTGNGWSILMTRVAHEWRREM